MPDPLKNSGTPRCTSLEGNPINIATGNKYLREVDFRLARLQFVRHYNSNREFVAHNGGNPWQHGYSARVALADEISGFLSVEATRPDGRVLRFSRLDGEWTTDLDVQLTIVELTDGAGNRTGWKLFTEDNRIEEYDANGTLVSITDQDRFVQTLSYDVDNRLTAVSDHFGRSLTLIYDSSDQIASVTDPDGATYRYEYDSSDNLASVIYPDDTPSDNLDNPRRQYHYEDLDYPHALTGITDANGNRFATWSYDDQGRAISSEHANGAEQVNVTYNADGSTTVVDSLGHTRTYTFETIHGVVRTAGVSGPCSTCGGSAQSFTYDSAGFIATRIDFNGNETTYSYNDRGLETSRTEAFGSPSAREITTTWHPDFRLPVTVTRPGQSVVFTYDADSRLKSQTKTDTATGASRTTSFSYFGEDPGDDPELQGLLKTVDGSRNDVDDSTEYGYDSQGNLTSTTNALGHTTLITSHDNNGRPLVAVDPNGTTIQISYDERGRLADMSIGGQTTTFIYDAAGNLVQMELPTGTTIASTFDAAHRLVGVEDNLGNRIEYTLDSMGNRIREDVRDSSGTLRRTMSRTYNELNRLASMVGGESQTTTYSYDANGNRIELTDPRSNVTTQSVDALNRLISSEDPADGITTYTYDARDNLTSITDPRGLTTTYTYDGLDNRVEQDSPDTGITTYTHDAAGNRLTMTDARGTTVTYSYDALNRVTGIDYPDNSLDVTFSYDACTNGIGRRCTMTDGSGSTAYQYDAHGNVVERTITVGGITGSVGFAYDEADRLTQIAYPSGRTVDYTRDVLGQVTSIRLTHSDGITTETVVSGIAYAPFGPMTSLMFGNDIALSRDHDLDYRLTSQAAGGVQNVSFSYDGNGNLTALTDAIDGSRSQTLGYDALDRLTSAGGGYGSRNWSYDAVGNRLSSTGGGSETYSYAADSNRLIEYTTGSSYTVSYDANGNITGDGYYGFSYGDHNRLTEARVLGSPVATYTYNGLGQRVTKDNGAVTHFVYDQAGRLLGEYDGTGATRKEVIRLNGVPVAVFAGGAVSYVHSDQLGTPRLITDATGTVRWRWDPAPFGDTAVDGDPDGDGSYAEFNLRFPGQYYDSETGLHYNYYRDYVPGFGRYLESDPIGLEGGLNTYGYVGGNPLSFVDPLGLIWETYGIDYHGSKNWLRAILDRLANMEEGTVMSANNCFGCTRDVLQEWIPHPDDPENQRNYCAEEDPYPGQRRKVRQAFTELYDQWTGRDVGIWEPHVDRQTYEDFPNAN